MASILQSLSPVAALAAGSLVASIWQGFLLASCASFSLRSLPKLSAATRSLVWITVLLLAVALPFLALHANEQPIAAAHTSVLHLSQTWSLALLASWALFSLFRLGQLGLGAFHLHGLAHRAARVQPQAEIAALLQNSPRKTQLCTSAEVDRPSVVGFFRPRILLPPDLLQQLSQPELEQVVLHEMEHLRRCDDWTNLLQKLALALFPLNPVLLWLDRRLCLERELACDDGVLRATHAHKAYAACLTNLAEKSFVRRGILLALGIVGRQKESELARRIYRILRRPQVGLGRTQTRLATGALLTGMLGCAGALAHSPQLVSFSSGTQTVAEATASIPVLSKATTAQVAHVAAVTAIAAPRAVFAKAIVSAPERAAAVKAVAVKAVRKQPTVLKTSFNQPAPGHFRPQPRVALASWPAEAPVSARVVFAVEEDSPFTYAAVPVRGGWLIVQL